MSVAAQDAPWWKQLFKAKSSAAESVASPVDAPTDSRQEAQDFPGLPEVPASGEMFELEVELDEVFEWEDGLFVRQHDSRLDTLDSLWLLSPPPLKGYRVQIFLGPLNEARAVRAKFRRGNGLQPIYLISAAPSYRVVLGNFRSRWEAERMRQDWSQRYPHALVLPMAIELPPLTGNLEGQE
jgi:hypothetical protein